MVRRWKPPRVCGRVPGALRGVGAEGVEPERQTHRTKRLEKTAERAKTVWLRAESRGIKRGGPELVS